MAGVFYFPLRNDYTDEEKDKSDVEKMNGVFVDNSNVLDLHWMHPLMRVKNLK